MDCLQTTAVARINQYAPYSPQMPQSILNHNDMNHIVTSYTSSQSPIRSVTSKILSTFDVSRPKRGPSKEQLYQTMMTQQQQLQHLTSQQQYLQAQILWQQKQLKEAEMEMFERSRSRSRGSKEESDKEAEKVRKISSRMEIQEHLQKQQTQVAQHILNLNY